MDRKQREDAINEVHVLKAMKHPYIITYKESFMDKRCLCIVMDYADGGDLYTKIANQKKIGKGNTHPSCTDFIWYANMFPLYSLLLWRSNSGLVCLNGACNQAYSWQENSAQRFENAEHFHDIVRLDQNWWLRYCSRAAAHLRLCADCYRYTLLLVAWDLPGKTL